MVVEYLAYLPQYLPLQSTQNGSESKELTLSQRPREMAGYTALSVPEKLIKDHSHRSGRIPQYSEIRVAEVAATCLGDAIPMAPFRRDCPFPSDDTWSITFGRQMSTMRHIDGLDLIPTVCSAMYSAFLSSFFPPDTSQCSRCSYSHPKSAIMRNR